MLTQLSTGEVWAKHATYGGPYTPRLLPSILMYATGREAALKQNVRNTYPRRKVEETIARFLVSPQDTSLAVLVVRMVPWRWKIGTQRGDRGGDRLSPSRPASIETTCSDLEGGLRMLSAETFRAA